MKIIFITAQKGGVGKSTISFLLAKYLSENDFKVGVVDIDNQGTFLSNKDFILQNNKFDILTWKDVTNDPESLENLYNYLIIDGPPYNMTLFKDIISLSDHVIVPVKMEDISITSILETLKRIENDGAKDKTILVPSMVAHNRNYSEQYEAIDSLGFYRIENPIILYAALTKVFLSEVEFDGNIKINIEKSILDIIKFIHQ
jgi:cellulose biosynthesis protein BcsQ